jgi:hypothetical protein
MENQNGNGTSSKPGANADANSTTTKKQNFVANWVFRLGKNFEVEITTDMARDYVIALARLSEPVLHVAFRKCLETWGKVHSMPPIAFLLDLAAKYRSTMEDELTSAAKWGDEEAKRLLAELQAKAPQLPPLDNTMPDDRRTFVEREIRAMRERYPKPDGKPVLAPGAPTDPEARRAWAHEKAVEMGWFTEPGEREPGEEEP